MYSESTYDKRIPVWFIKIDNKYVIVSKSNFGTLKDLRNIQLRKILK